MKKFLSIDWDFFIKATMEERCLLFPDGGSEHLPEVVRKYVWDSRYRDPRLLNIGVHKPLLDSLVRVTEGSKPLSLVAMDSHKYMYDFVNHFVDKDEEFEVYNLDFHHDLYDFPTEKEPVNCGNWARELLKEHPNMHYSWIKHHDSDAEGVPKEYQSNFANFLSRLSPKDIQYIFICRSAVWSPPHLDKYFVSFLREVIRNLLHFYVENGIGVPREYDIPDMNEVPPWVSIVSSGIEEDSSPQ